MSLRSGILGEQGISIFGQSRAIIFFKIAHVLRVHCAFFSKLSLDLGSNLKIQPNSRHSPRVAADGFQMYFLVF